ncbi:bacteriohemerythrin [Candidatus Riflebacteria bacterium]
MAMFEWDETQSVCVKIFDDQHKRLFTIMNNLYEAMLAGKGREVEEKTLRELYDYSNYHFNDEENKMVQLAYPEYEGHKALHELFITKVKELQQDFEKNQLKVTMETLKFLKTWWFKHIQTADKKYSTHFNQKGLF